MTAGPQIEMEAIRRMKSMLVGALPLMPVLPCIAAAALWPVHGGWRLGLWLTAALLAPALRGLLVRRYRASVTHQAQAVRWANEVTVSSAVDGLAWGVAGFFFLATDSPALQMLLLTLIVGISAGSVFVTSFWPRTEYAFALPSVGLTALGLALRGGESGWGLALGLLVYLGILHGIMVQAHAATTETIRLRFEKDALLADLQRQKEVAVQANTDKSWFLAAASHDLRQPLHALGLFAQALHERAVATPLQPLAERIGASVAALEGLLNALLDVSRLDAGVLHPQCAPVLLHALAHRLGAEFGPLAQAQGLAWRCKGPDVAVLSDPALLETLLRNLLSNAVRYTPHGEVALLWHADTQEGTARRVALSVCDTGIGIAPEHQQDVFKEFVQLHNSERDRAKGLGLGLAVVDRLARLLDHGLEMRSVPGQGSTFTLSLQQMPLPQQPADPSTLGEELAVGAPAPPVLVMDDEAEVRAAMALLLRGWGYEVVATTGARDALDQLAQPPQAIVVDYRLRAGETGAEAIAAVRAVWGQAIPALIVTGDTAPDRLREAAASGHPVLHKPASPARLRAFLRHAGRGGV